MIYVVDYKKKSFLEVKSKIVAIMKVIFSFRFGVGRVAQSV
jgi:hypothetical protein